MSASEAFGAAGAAGESPARRKLPIGIQTFRKIREDGFYAEKYRHLRRPVHLIGMEFSKAERNIAGFEVERAA